jgi:hypothetical protein
VCVSIIDKESVCVCIQELLANWITVRERSLSLHRHSRETQEDLHLSAGFKPVRQSSPVEQTAVILEGL